MTNNADFLLYITIAIVYVTLMSMVIDRFLNIEGINDRCEFRLRANMSEEEQAAEDERQKNCDDMRREYRDKYFAYNVTLGVASMLVGGYAIMQNDSYATAGAGVALGGTLAVIYNTILNWHRITTDLKIVIMAVALVAMVYGSVKLYDQ